MHGNGLALIQPRMKIFSFQHACQTIVRTEPNNIFGRHFAQPLTVVADFGFFTVEDLEDLGEIGFGVGVNSLTG